MNCLIDFIGVRYTLPIPNPYGIPAPATPDSGLYINDLPGITLNQLICLNDSDQNTWYDLWESVQTRAQKIFETNFTNAMSKKYQLKKITESFQLSSTVDEASVTPRNEGELRGIYINCQFVKSPFHYIPIDQVKLFLPADGNTTIYIYEVLNGTTNDLLLLDQFALNGVAGWNTININKKYADSRTLFICYDASGVDSVALELDSYELNSIIYQMQSKFLWAHMYINGASYANGAFLSNNAFNTYGLTATISLKCAFDVLVCNFKNDLALAWWCLLGAELMRDRIYTDRINRYTQIDRDTAKSLRAELTTEYEKELSVFVDSVDLNSDWCIDCNEQLVYRTSLP